MIDGEEKIDFRITTGYTNHHSHVNYDKIWMEKGHHHVSIEYMANQNAPNFGLRSWNIVMFKVGFYQ